MSGRSGAQALEIRILMLEDSELDAELTLGQLGQSRFDVDHTRVDDRAGYERELRQGCPDLIISDYSLPAFDGMTALSIAQQICPDVPFIVVSGALGEEIAVEMLKRGAVDYVLKRHLERLGSSVRRALNVMAERRERRRAEAALAQKAQELQASIGDLEQFAYATSHDLQEPLRTISIFARLVSKRYSGQLDSTADEYLNYIESAAQHMSALLEDLLTYTRVPAQERHDAEVDLNAVVNQLLYLFQRQIESAGASVTVGDLPVVIGNEKQLSLVMQNLLSNALKYRSAAPPEIRISSKENGVHEICVSDNGVGFEQVYSNHIFGLFKRLRKDDAPGTGLGLAICKRIVELHGGVIWAESSPGSGARFYFTLPKAKAATSMERAQPLRSAEVS